MNKNKYCGTCQWRYEDSRCHRFPPQVAYFHETEVTPGVYHPQYEYPKVEVGTRACGEYNGA